MKHSKDFNIAIGNSILRQFWTKTHQNTLGLHQINLNLCSNRTREEHCGKIKSTHKFKIHMTNDNNSCGVASSQKNT